MGKWANPCEGCAFRIDFTSKLKRTRRFARTFARVRRLDCQLRSNSLFIRAMITFSRVGRMYSVELFLAMEAPFDIFQDITFH
jgi:hypothetical protein